MKAILVGILILACGGVWANPKELVDAIRTLDREDTSVWTKDGRPRVSALEATLGRDIRAAERDAAWDAYKLCAPAHERVVDLEARVVDLEAAVAIESARHIDAVSGLAAWKSRAHVAERSATLARKQAQDAGQRLAVTEAKLKAYTKGESLCASERIAVAAEINVLFDDLDAAAIRLLDCLSVGE